MTEPSEILFEVPTRSGGAKDGRVEASTRGEAELVTLAAAGGRDVVELELVNGPTLVLNPEHARDLFAAQGTASRASRSGAVRVPTRLAWRSPELDRELSRGMNEVGQVVLHAFRVVKETISSQGANWVASEAALLLDQRVPQGLRRIEEKGLSSERVTLPPGGKPLLVLLHGTFSTALESFGKLWQHEGLIGSVLEKFDAYAFEHPTLTQSPLENALELAKLLPIGAEVSFLTHSRGGLVAEALAQLTDDAQTDAASLRAEKYRAELEALQQLLLTRKLKVRRIVRVACPARGTLLASGRLDVYLSLLKWALELGQIPVAKELVGFLHEVAKRRTKPDELPGLECLMPESGFIRWLNHSDREIGGELRVIAGDIQGDSLSSWLKTLVSDAFYWTDNDLIVQTRSMYGGRPRADGSLFFLDRGGAVSHFDYYANRSTALAIQRALLDQQPEQFRSIGQLSRSGVSSSGSRGGSSDIVQVLAASKSKAKPAVILLPGILGSKLTVDGQLIWLGIRIINGLPRLQYGGPGKVEATGWMGPYYDDLARYLAESHEVISFPFDWRKPIEEEALRLADVITEALEGRSEPVRILAHSLGGLVARTVEKVKPDVWHALMKHDRSRFVMLGTPNAGSWAPMQVLSGDNLIGNLVANVGALFDEHRARELFAALPGFIQLQAGLLDPTLRLSEQSTWQALAKADRMLLELFTPWHNLQIQRTNLNWGIPKQALLDAARALHTWLSQQDLRSFGNRVVMVVGTAEATPSGYDVNEAAPDFGYLETDRGDGTVTLSSALLPGVRAFQVEVEHARLPTPKQLYPGYLSLLENGTPDDPRLFTSLLSMRGGGSAAPPLAASSARAPRVARLRGWNESELDELEGTLTLPTSVPAPSQAAVPALKISVTNGDLTFVNQPLMLGHYTSLAVTGAEKVVDRFLGGTMSRALRLRAYPMSPGEAKVFDNQREDPNDPHAAPRPPAVVVVGLGAESELRAEELAMTVRHGVIEHAARLSGDPEQATTFELAATLIGSGGMGIAVATAARAVARGVYAANERLLEQNAPSVAKLHFIELYEDRASEALRELLDMAAQKPAAFQVERWLNPGTNPLVRPLSSAYRGADYDMVSVREGPQVDGMSSIAFAIDTRRARTEVRSTTTQLPLVQALIDQAEADRRGDGALGKTLFQMLVPRELDSFFAGSDAVLLQLDGATAGVPWELLSVDSDEQQRSEKPWSIRAKLVRKLQTSQFREHPVAAGHDATVLVIGDPLVDDRNRYPSLPGARSEAEAVAKVLGGSALLGASAVEFVNALLGQNYYSIVHIAGHGKEDGSGVVVSGNLVLGAELVRSMRRVPDLVFVNCCFSARQRVGQLPQQAATLARALIDAGVRCVVATGWAVDDDAAKHFAEELYRRLLGRQKFVDATAAARESTWREYPLSNTWAAYQCYGDPDWVLLPRRAEKTDEPSQPHPGQAQPESPIVSPAGLVVALKTLGTQGIGGDEASRVAALARVRQLEMDMDRQFGKHGEVAEAFANAYSNLGDRHDAIRWYERAVHTEKGATFKSLEQLFNLSVRGSAEAVERVYFKWEQAQDNKTPQSEELARAVDTASTEFDEREEDLKCLANLPRTSERLSLVASSWKRRAMVAYAGYTALGKVEARDAMIRAITQSQSFYEQAAKLAEKEHGKNVGYARLNAMTVELVLGLVSGKIPAANPQRIADVRQKLELWAEDKSEFWPFVQLIEVDVYEAICRGALGRALPGIKSKFDDLWKRMANPREWASVRDQANLLLRAYWAVASAEERKAADELRKVLNGYAPGEP